MKGCSYSFEIEHYEGQREAKELSLNGQHCIDSRRNTTLCPIRKETLLPMLNRE